MKKIFVILYSIILLSGCGKDPENPVNPPVPPKQYVTVNVTFGSGGKIVPSGTTVWEVGQTPTTFQIIPDDGYITKQLMQDKTATSLINPALFTAGTHTLEATFKPMYEVYLQTDSWVAVLFEMRSLYPTGQWYPGTPNKLTYKFDETYHFQNFDANNVLIGDGKYLISKDSLIVGYNQSNGSGGIRSVIWKLTPDTLIVSGVSRTVDGKYSETRYTYVRPKKSVKQ